MFLEILTYIIAIALITLFALFLSEKRKTANDVSKIRSDIHAVNKSLEDSVSNLKQNIGELEKTVNSLTDSAWNHVQRITQLEENVNSLTECVSNLDQRLTQLGENVNALAFENKELRKKLEFFTEIEADSKILNDFEDKSITEHNIQKAIDEIKKRAGAQGLSGESEIVENKATVDIEKLPDGEPFEAETVIEKKPEGNPWVNGSLGIVSYLSDFVIKVRIDGQEYEITREVFTEQEAVYVNDKIVYRDIFSVLQYPILLAYAITIHKSQGMTYPRIACDISNCFAKGQAYVALSRCSSLDGLFLLKEIKDERFLQVDSDIKEFYYTACKRRRSEPQLELE